LGKLQTGFAASGVVESKNFNKITPQTHHWHQLLLVKNVDYTSQKILFINWDQISPSPALKGV